MLVAIQKKLDAGTVKAVEEAYPDATDSRDFKRRQANARKSAIAAAVAAEKEVVSTVSLFCDLAPLQDALRDVQLWGVDTEAVAGPIVTLESRERMRAELHRCAEEGTACDFVFVYAHALKGMASLLSMQELRQSHPEWLVVKRFTFAAACKGAYVDEFLAVSHRCSALLWSRQRPTRLVGRPHAMHGSVPARSLCATEHFPAL